MNKPDFLKVYVSALPSVYEGKALYPKERQNYVENIKKPKQKQEAHYAWCLLKYAFSKEFDVDFNDINFKTSSNGKWSCDVCDFSISHTDGAVAVAISNQSVGIDIEKIKALSSDSFAARTLTQDELAEYCALSESAKKDYLIKKWTQKEAIFKSLNHPSFVPSKIDTLSYNVFSKKIVLNCNVEYFLSVFAQNKKASLIEYVSEKEILPF